MIDQDLVTYLIGLSTGAGNRVHTGNIPENSALPAIVINRLPGTRPRTTNNSKLAARTPLSIGVIAKDYASAMPLAVAIRDGLDGLANAVMTDTRVHSCRCTSELTYFEEVDGDKTLRAISQDFFFVHSEI